jgi:glutamine amidotransferase
MISIIDYDAGNIMSVEKAIRHLGEELIITNDPDRILSSDKVILPGVGAFGDAMDKIRKAKLDRVIYEVVDRKIPFIGICLGLQLLFESSQEAPGVPGLGLLEGKILRIPEKDGIKIPHMGWNALHITQPEGQLFSWTREGDFVYFVHSFACRADDRADVLFTARYGQQFDAAVQRGNICGMQFHPEKSGPVGERLLANFAAMKKEVR